MLIDKIIIASIIMLLACLFFVMTYRISGPWGTVVVFILVGLLLNVIVFLYK